MKRLTLMLIALMIFSGIAAAATDKTINVKANVSTVNSYDVKVFRSTGETTYDWGNNLFPEMNFGTLVNAPSVPGGAPDPVNALMGSYHFCALVSVTNNSGGTYRVAFSGSPLKHTIDGVTQLSNDAFTVVGGVHYNQDGSVATAYPAGVNVSKRSAGLETAYDVYNSNSAGMSDIFRVYVGITGNPADGVDANGNGKVDLISPTQKAGNYAATLHLTLYP